MDEQPVVDPSVLETAPDSPLGEPPSAPAPVIVETPVTAPPESVPPADADSAVVVKYRGMSPTTDTVIRQRWAVGQERTVPWSVATALVKSRFFSCAAIPESLLQSR